VHRIISGFAALALLQACANKAEDVSAAQVSTIGYESLECQQLVEERDGLKTKIAEVSAEQDDKAGSDAVTVAVAAIVFLPAAVFLAAGEDRSGELSRLKGEFDAVTKVAATNECNSPTQLEEERIAAEEAQAKLKAEQAKRHSNEGR